MVYLVQGKYEKAKAYYEKLNGEDYFEFDFPFVHSDCVFREIDRFLWESKRKTRFKNRYEGKVLVDISNWNDKYTNEYFDAFIYFLKDNSSLDVSFICQKKCKEHILDTLEGVFEIIKVEVELEKHQKTKRKIGFCVNEEDNGNVRG